MLSLSVAGPATWNFRSMLLYLAWKWNPFIFHHRVPAVSFMVAAGSEGALTPMENERMWYSFSRNSCEGVSSLPSTRKPSFPPDRRINSSTGSFPMAEESGHKHYEKPEGDDRPSKKGAVAPRLQNLGTHTFKVTTKSGQAQRFINQTKLRFGLWDEILAEKASVRDTLYLRGVWQYARASALNRYLPDR